MVLSGERLERVRVSNELIRGFSLHDLTMIPQRGQLNMITVPLTPQECFSNTIIASQNTAQTIEW